MQHLHPASVTARDVLRDSTEALVKKRVLLPRPGGRAMPLVDAAPKLLVIAMDKGLHAVITGMVRPPWELTAVGSGEEAIGIIARGRRFTAILCDAELPDYGCLAVREAIAGIAPSQAQRVTLMSPVLRGWDLMLLARRECFRVLARPFTEAVFRSVLLPPTQGHRGARRR